MVVDDESVVRMDIREMLEEAGYEVVAEASNGEAAVEQALSSHPDLILMDIKMPKLDGLKASRIISKKLPVPIVVLTAYSQSQYVDEAKDAGIVGYLVKPVSESDLIPGVEIALAAAQRVQHLNEKIGSLQKEMEVRKLVERAKGLVMQDCQLSEDQAYKKMREYCMNQRTSMESLAKRILSSGTATLQ
jgi:AmiR/NasT family two-component response regulator